MNSLPAAQKPSTAEPAAPGTLLELAVFVNDTLETHPLPSQGVVSIGRSADNHILIDHPSVSRYHARLHLAPGLRVEDLGGANGTLVHAPGRAPSALETSRSVARATVEVSVGDHINFGSVMSVVRHCSSRTGRAPPGSEGVVLSDPAMRALYAQAELAAESLISVLLLGETGVGKEVLARTIHRCSPRAAGPFLAINCAALPESLLDGELFGHEKGAFTGASQSRPGLFETADGGTVFLDEAGDLPMTVQVKLLRVLEERQVLPVGGRAPRPVNVRFIAATNADLAAKVAGGTFRLDLFYRLDGLSLTIPPLRDRVADIAPLAELFAARASRELGCPPTTSLSAEALAVLEHHDWPGNVRELRNVIERAVVLSRGGEILPAHLPSSLAAGHAPGSVGIGPGIPAPGVGATQPMPRLLKGTLAERELITATLAACSGNQTRAAEQLGISRRTLVSRLEEHGLARPRKKV